MENHLAEIIGFSAAFLGAVHMVPQLVKSLKTKSVEDVSFYMIFLYFFATGLWAVYGYMVDSMPVLVGDGFNFLVTCTLLIVKLKYDREEKSQTE